jgi:hypothetical protein
MVERTRPDIHMELFGSGVEEQELHERARSHGLGNLKFPGRVSAPEMIG